ncbi:hypothetical protein JG687_00016064 [Phytophthora cactorum]|uniref:Uncharacterized protein n=1 Tax=Phytophthora cactorum TaxID=29920 RepID=A0A8T1TS21_9STRA|nr:hypothetical protein JG687_00016064 [Phytophthora cactorum]
MVGRSRSSTSLREARTSTSLIWASSTRCCHCSTTSRPATLTGSLRPCVLRVEEMDSVTTIKCFLTLQSVLEASMLVRGGNSYDISHVKKDALIRAGKLLRCLSCSAEAMQMSL